MCQHSVRKKDVIKLSIENSPLLHLVTFHTWVVGNKGREGKRRPWGAICRDNKAPGVSTWAEQILIDQVRKLDFRYYKRFKG